MVLIIPAGINDMSIIIVQIGTVFVSEKQRPLGELLHFAREDLSIFDPWQVFWNIGAN
jgi:hypothetical protein